MAGPARGLRHADVAERRYVAGAAGAKRVVVCDEGAFGVDAVCGGGIAVVVGENGCAGIGAQNEAMFGAEVVEEGFPGCGGGREGGVVVRGRRGDGVEGRRE